jgi:hypothetical protein
MKRQLAKFRRRDGKRIMLDQMALSYAESFELAQDERERLAQEYDDSRWWHNPDDDYDCYCCRPEHDQYIHDDVDYYDMIQDYDDHWVEDAYQREQAEADWAYDWYGPTDYSLGYMAGFEAAQRMYNRRAS